MITCRAHGNDTDAVHKLTLLNAMLMPCTCQAALADAKQAAAEARAAAAAAAAAKANLE